MFVAGWRHALRSEWPFIIIIIITILLHDDDDDDDDYYKPFTEGTRPGGRAALPDPTPCSCGRCMVSQGVYRPPQVRQVGAGVAPPAPRALFVHGLQVVLVERLSVAWQPALVVQQRAPALLVHVAGDVLLLAPAPLNRVYLVRAARLARVVRLALHLRV